MFPEDIKLLSDAQVQQFIVDGFLVLPLDELGDVFHRGVYHLTIERRPNAELTDELDAAIPQVRTLLDSPTVRGALQSILGPGYIRHPHSGATVDSCDLAAAQARGRSDQGWHRDSYWGVQRVHHHRPRWLLCMYYPATISLEMGPTAIVPGSQYYSLPGDGDGRARPPVQPIRHDLIDDPQRIMQGNDLVARDRLLRTMLKSLDPSLREVPMVVKAGSFCCFHYDVYHRRMR